VERRRRIYRKEKYREGKKGEELSISTGSSRKKK
jgi:hypothetical protein